MGSLSMARPANPTEEWYFAPPHMHEAAGRAIIFQGADLPELEKFEHDKHTVFLNRSGRNTARLFTIQYPTRWQLPRANKALHQSFRLRSFSLRFLACPCRLALSTQMTVSAPTEPLPRAYRSL
jgi:hypothetical protein